MSLRRIFVQFLAVGSTAFGGPLALIGLMQERLVERQRMVSSEDLAESVAVGQVLPGPVAVNAATSVGYRLRGVAGALTATAGVVLPAFLIMLVLSPLYIAYGEVPQAEAFFRGTRAAVVAVVLAACFRMSKKMLKNRPHYAIAGLVFALAVLCRVGPLAKWTGPRVPVEALLVVVAGVLGIVLCPPGPEPGQAAGGTAQQDADAAEEGQT